MAAARFHPVLIVLLVFNGSFAFGEENPTGNKGYIDRSQVYADRKINAVVTWFDDLFGGPAQADTEKPDNKLQWSNELRVEKGYGVKYRTSLNAHVRLPKFEKRLRLVITEENREEAVAPVPLDPGTPVANTPAKENSLRAVHSELRYYAYDTKAGYAFLSAGSRFVWPPETFVRARALWRRPLMDNTFITPSVTPFWQDHIGFGVTPQLDIGHTFPDNYIIVWANSATLYEERTGLLWGTEVSLSKILSPVSAVAFAVGATGSTRPSLVADRFKMGANNYRVSVKYRRSIYRPWLFLELIPEANWRRDEAMGREFAPAFTARVEINSTGPRALLPVPVIVEEHLPVPRYAPH